MREFNIYLNFLSERIIDFIIYNIFFLMKKFCPTYFIRSRDIWHTITLAPIVFSEMWVRCADTRGVLWYVRRWNGDESARRKMRPRQEIQRHEKLHSRRVQSRMVLWPMEQGNAYMHFEINTSSICGILSPFNDFEWFCSMILFKDRFESKIKIKIKFIERNW